MFHEKIYSMLTDPLLLVLCIHAHDSAMELRFLCYIILYYIILYAYRLLNEARKSNPLKAMAYNNFCVCSKRIEVNILKVCNKRHRAEEILLHYVVV